MSGCCILLWLFLLLLLLYPGRKCDMSPSYSIDVQIFVKCLCCHEWMRRHERHTEITCNIKTSLNWYWNKKNAHRYCWIHRLHLARFLVYKFCDVCVFFFFSFHLCHFGGVVEWSGVGAHELYTFRAQKKRRKKRNDSSEGKYLSCNFFNRKQCKNKYCAPVDDDDDRV